MPDVPPVTSARWSAWRGIRAIEPGRIPVGGTRTRPRSECDVSSGSRAGEPTHAPPLPHPPVRPRRGARRARRRARGVAGGPGRRPRAERQFAGGTGGWTSTSSCAPLCSVTNAFDPARRERPRLGDGRSTRRWPACSAASRPARAPGRRRASPGRARSPSSATLSLARKAAIGGLLAVGGTATARVQLRDLTTGRRRRSRNEWISTAEASFATHIARDRPVAARAGALLPPPADDEPRRRRAAERHPRVLRRRRAHGRRRGRRRQHGRHRRHGRQRRRERRRERLRSRPARARGPSGAAALRLAAPRVVRFTPRPRRHDARARHPCRQGRRGASS